MLCKMIVEVPASLDIEDEQWQADNQTICYEISRLGTQWPGLLLSSTKILSDKKIMLCSLTIPGDNKLLLVQGLLLVYGLDWKILGLQEFGASKVEEDRSIVPYIFLSIQPDVLLYQDDRFSTIQDELGNSTSVLLTPEVSWVPIFSGQSPWV